MLQILASMEHFSHFILLLDLFKFNLAKSELFLFCFSEFFSVQASPVCWSYWDWEISLCEGEVDE